MEGGLDRFGFDLSVSAPASEARECTRTCMTERSADVSHDQVKYKAV